MSRVVVVLAALAVCAVAQPLLPVPGNNLILTDSNPPTVSVFDPVTQSQTTLTTNPAMQIPAGAWVTDQRDVVVADFTGLSIHRVDMLGNFTTAAAGLLNNPIRVTQDYNGDIIYTGNALIYAPSSLMRLDGAGNATTVAVLAGNPFGVTLDPDGISNAGSYVVTIPLLGDVVRIDGGGMITPIASGLPGPLSIARFRNGDFAVTMQYTDEIVRIPRNGGAAVTWVGPAQGLGNIKDIIPDWNGGFYVTEAGGALGSRLMHVDATGTVTQVLGNGSFGLFQSAALSPTLVAPTAVNSGPTAGLFGIAIDFPAQPNAAYLAFMSGGAYPGIAFPAPDLRGSPLQPDPLFLGTFGVGAPGITTGWAGTLGGSGTGLILVDLTPYPVGVFSGGRVHMQVALIDPLAQTGISALSNMITLAFP